MTYVQLDKLSQQNAGPLPEQYWLRGFLVFYPEVGKPICVKRTERCGREPDEPEVVVCLGEYVSSPVQEILEGADGSLTCRTRNSYWRVTPLAPPETA